MHRKSPLQPLLSHPVYRSPPEHTTSLGDTVYPIRNDHPLYHRGMYITPLEYITRGDNVLRPSYVINGDVMYIVVYGTLLG